MNDSNKRKAYASAVLDVAAELLDAGEQAAREGVPVAGFPAAALGELFARAAKDGVITSTDANELGDRCNKLRGDAR